MEKRKFLVVVDPSHDRHLARGFRMADCIVRPDRGSIARPGEDAEFVEPKLMEVLLHLAAADGELVERRELLDAHWHEGADCDGALTRVVCALRRALGDDSRHPRFIGTVHKHGYRLLVHAKPLTQGETGHAGHEPMTADQPLMISAQGAEPTARSSLLGELKRRRVIRVATAYAVAGWLIVQIAETTFEPLGVPEWGLTLLVLFVALGFPLAVVLAWAVQLTPDGPVLDMQVAGMPAATHSGKAGGLPLVVAAALESGAYRPDSRVDTAPGFMQVGDVFVGDSLESLVSRGRGHRLGGQQRQGQGCPRAFPANDNPLRRKALPDLITIANNAGLDIASVTVQEPDLEAVFLHLTGRALRE